MTSAVAAEITHPEEVLPFLVSLVPTIIVAFIATVAATAAICWFLWDQFARNRKMFYVQLAALEAKFEIALKSHEAADVARFDQVWEYLVNRPSRRPVDSNPPPPLSS